MGAKSGIFRNPASHKGKKSAFQNCVSGAFLNRVDKYTIICKSCYMRRFSPCIQQEQYAFNSPVKPATC